MEDVENIGNWQLLAEVLISEKVSLYTKCVYSRTSKQIRIGARKTVESG